MNIPVATYIREIRQKDNYTFTIIWHDLLEADYRLSQLQANCPCAACHELKSGNTGMQEAAKEEVRAIRIYSVGRYALRIHFTSGCSMGIYDFAMLYNMVRNVQH